MEVWNQCRDPEVLVKLLGLFSLVLWTFNFGAFLKSFFESLRLLEFRPQIAKKAMPPKPPQDIQKTPSSGSKRRVNVIDVDDDAEMEQSEFVDITKNRIATSRPAYTSICRVSRFQWWKLMT